MVLARRRIDREVGHHLPPLSPHESQCERVGIGNALGFGIDHDDPCRHGREQRRHVILAFAQFLFDLLALGNVARESEAEFLSAELHVAGANLHREDLSEFGFVTGFKSDRTQGFDLCPHCGPGFGRQIRNDIGD